ncbi:MAG: hypothetical protein J5822_00615 [Eubacteriaceae bacterium]|nr:hypothetical protein [Eubacteriaceae bacterium]
MEEKTMTNAEYLRSIADELIADEEWDLPKELRFWLMGNFAGDLLYL